MDFYHQPVLLKEVINALKVEKGKRYIDTTIGGGGHAFAILKRGGRVLGIDCDQEAIDYVEKKIKNQPFGFAQGEESKIKNNEDLILVKGNFKDADKIALLNGFNQVAGIVFDLGLSSHQIKGKRGFSYQENGPLDMRMDQDLPVMAKDLINGLTKGELDELFTKLGEEHYARAISDNIIRARGIKPIETNQELVQLVLRAYGMRKMSAKNKAIACKKVFQALRIAVNDELNNLKEALPRAIKLLEKNGKLVIISYHSLEDRIVKQFFKEFHKEEGLILTKKPIVPCLAETSQNPRSKRAKLRIFERR